MQTVNEKPLHHELFGGYYSVPGVNYLRVDSALPISRQEMDKRNWEQCDIILVNGDAYVDHPSFGVPLIGRVLERLGYRVGIIAQPQSVEDFRVLGPPLLCWGVSAGNIDSQLSRQTIMRRPRHDDPYSPNAQAGLRPANASIVYTTLARQAFKGIPVILGGVEASLRRFAYYDYWSDKVKRSLLFDAKANLIVFGMGERAIAEIARCLRQGKDLSGITGCVEIRPHINGENIVELPAFETVSQVTDAGKASFAEMARLIHLHTDSASEYSIIQRHGDRWLWANPAAQPLTAVELDEIYTLPFTRCPHPSYGDAHIPAYEMIKDSITTHRGCYSGCSFCAIGAHQGTKITSRSEKNILQEIRTLTRSKDFHGTVSDLGGPTANMYQTGCALGRTRCLDKSCLFPRVCKNLRTDHAPLLHLMRSARNLPGVKHLFITSGIRCDLATTPAANGYINELARFHVGGRLKIAPEHIAPEVLSAMRKSDAKPYRQFVKEFLAASNNAGKDQQVVEYFMSGHPGCTLADMISLAEYLQRKNILPEQVQDYYPVPLTLAAAMFYTGLHPLTGESIYVARTATEKAQQRALLLWHQPVQQRLVRDALQEAGREDLIGYSSRCLVAPATVTGKKAPSLQPRDSRDDDRLAKKRRLGKRPR